MEIETKKVNELKEAEYNPRVITEEEFEGLVQSYRAFGLVEPLIWNKQTETLVGGHQRLKVLKSEGVEEVEVSVVDLNPEMEKALNIALNSHSISGKYDNDSLRTLLDELKLTIPSDLYDGLRMGEIEPPEIKIIAPADYGSKNVEFNANTFGGDLKHMCPKCGFEFGE